MFKPKGNQMPQDPGFILLRLSYVEALVNIYQRIAPPYSNRHSGAWVELCELGNTTSGKLK